MTAHFLKRFYQSRLFTIGLAGIGAMLCILAISLGAQFAPSYHGAIWRDHGDFVRTAKESVSSTQKYSSRLSTNDLDWPNHSAFLGCDANQYGGQCRLGGVLDDAHQYIASTGRRQPDFGLID